MPPLRAVTVLLWQVAAPKLVAAHKLLGSGTSSARAAGAGVGAGVGPHAHGMPLGRVVLFSSVAALIGAAGQANYVAANAGLDAAAEAWSSAGACVAGRRIVLPAPLVRATAGPWAR
jgi:hypothetical protein